MNSQRGTWKQKLEIVAELVDANKEQVFFKGEGLATMAAYLYFVSSG